MKTYKIVYTIANKDENSLSIFIANMGADILYEPEFELFDKFTKLDVFGGEAEIIDNKLKFKTDIYAFTTVCVKLYK